MLNPAGVDAIVRKPTCFPRSHDALGGLDCEQPGTSAHRIPVRMLIIGDPTNHRHVRAEKILDRRSQHVRSESAGGLHERRELGGGTVQFPFSQPKPESPACQSRELEKRLTEHVTFRALEFRSVVARNSSVHPLPCIDTWHRFHAKPPSISRGRISPCEPTPLPEPSAVSCSIPS